MTGDVRDTAPEGLAALEARVHRDMADLCQWPANWVPETSVAGERALDVLVVGGGMCGMLVWHALSAAGVRNTRIVDRSPAGLEGPWLTYARMETLRSPKHLTGPAYGHGPLTFRAWFRAQWGEEAWERLDKIPRTMWMDYLKWYRHVLGVPVENEVEVLNIRPEGALLRVDLTVRGTPESLLTRKLVMATGREGTGRPNIPGFVEGVPRERWAHSSDDIDFAALKGRRVAVVGIGASAVDNGAEALEAGAAEVRFLIRRETMPTVNKMMGIGSFGFSAGYAALNDEWRWRFMNYSFVTQTPAPRGSTLRVSRHDNAYFHFGKAVERVAPEGAGLHVGFGDGTALDTDYLILCTGFRTDPLARTEFGAAAGEIKLWKDAYTPPPGEENEELAHFPYLGRDFSFQERHEGAAPWLSNTYCFNYGAAASMGKVSGDIPGISEGAAWLTREISATLYAEDIERHWQILQDYDKPELLGDEWTESPLPGERPARDKASA